MEKVISSLIANMSYPICAVDMDNKFIFVNKMYAKITGKTEDEFIGSRKEDVFDKSTCEQLNECYRTARETGEVTFLNIFTNEGYKDCTIVPVKDMSGEITALLGIIGIEKEIIGINKQQKELDFQKNLTRAIIEILPGIIFCKNIKGEYIYMPTENVKSFMKNAVYMVLLEN
ncbi:PAS domain-containing protein [uncultured Clostridium sp.]|uniref:PAS domain-containing protein n=1 Tax=uncultured Clostridium sp. TaxID=59620 RepID=UPI0025FA3864|nr:PAS domain-containing protein [uncultured Clostridium sp.]